MFTSAVLAFAVAVVGGGLPAQASHLVVLSVGHVDVFDVAYEDGVLELLVHDETVEPGVERDPADVLFKVLPGAQTVVPDDPAYAFLGDAGDPVWVLPQTEDPALLFAGWASEEIPAGVFVNDSVRLRVHRVFGPGDFSIFFVDEFGAPTVLVDNGNGLPDSFTIPAGVHVHANWGFQKPGFYGLVVSATGVLAATGERVTSDREFYSFVVRSA